MKMVYGQVPYGVRASALVRNGCQEKIENYSTSGRIIFDMSPSDRHKNMSEDESSDSKFKSWIVCFLDII